MTTPQVRMAPDGVSPEAVTIPLAARLPTHVELMQRFGPSLLSRLISLITLPIHIGYARDSDPQMLSHVVQSAFRLSKPFDCSSRTLAYLGYGSTRESPLYAPLVQDCQQYVAMSAQQLAEREVECPSYGTSALRAMPEQDRLSCRLASEVQQDKKERSRNFVDCFLNGVGGAASCGFLWWLFTGSANWKYAAAAGGAVVYTLTRYFVDYPLPRGGW